MTVSCAAPRCTDPMDRPCAWTHDAFGVRIHCPTHDNAIPGGLFCALCLIRWAAVQTPAYWLAHDLLIGLRR